MVSMWSEAELNFGSNVRFADNLRQMSDGRIDIEVFSSGAIMPCSEYFDALTGGVVDMFHSAGMYYQGRNIALGVLTEAVRLIGDIPLTLAWDQYGGGLELSREVYAKWDLYYLGSNVYTLAGESIVSKKPVYTFEDIKGFKVRASEAVAKLWAKIGASPVVIPGAEVYTALATGLVEAADWSSPAANYRLGYHEVAPYYSKPGQYLQGGLECTVMRMDTWESLPDDLKVMLEVAVREMLVDMWTVTANDDILGIEKLMAEGGIQFEWEPAVTKALREGFREVWTEDSKKSAMGVKCYNSIMDYAKAAGVAD